MSSDDFLDATYPASTLAIGHGVYLIQPLLCKEVESDACLYSVEHEQTTIP